MILATLGGTNLADISDAQDRKFTFQHMRPDTIEFKLPLQHAAIEELLYRQHCLVKLYCEDTLAGVYETASLQTTGDAGGNKKVAFVGIGAPWVRLQRRLFAKTAAGVTYTSQEPTAILNSVIVTVNLEAASGITVGSRTAVSGTYTVGPVRYRPALTLIQEIAATSVGYDFWFRPRDPATAGGEIAYIDAAGLRGATRPNVVFEYGNGTRANAREYEWKTDVTGRITRAYSLPPGYPDNTLLTVASASDAATEALSGMGRRETLVSDGLTDPVMRAYLMAEHVAVRKNPRQMFGIQPHLYDGTARVPKFMPFTSAASTVAEYDVGDVIYGRVKDEGLLFLNGAVRIYGVEVGLTNEGLEEISLTLTEDDASGSGAIQDSATGS